MKWVGTFKWLLHNHVLFSFIGSAQNASKHTCDTSHLVRASSKSHVNLSWMKPNKINSFPQVWLSFFNLHLNKNAGNEDADLCPIHSLHIWWTSFTRTTWLWVSVVHHVKCIAGESTVLICSTEEDKCLKFPGFKSSYNYLEVGKKVRHLGLVITEQMTDDDDIYGQRHKMYAQAINTLSR